MQETHQTYIFQHLSTYLNIEEVEVLEIRVVPEDNDCTVLIVLKGTWGERE